MKKIFATILALVMVLAMGSSLAMNCLSIDWSTVTNCGVGTVDVIPYVIGNAPTGNIYTVNECAGAINGQYVYFAVKVTVQENPNEEWWDNAELTIDYADGYGANNAVDAITAGNVLGTNAVWGNGTTYTADNLDTWIRAANSNNSLKAGEYFLTPNDGVNVNGVTTSFSPARNLFAIQVANVALGTDICVTLESEARAVDGPIEINGHTVSIETTDTSIIWPDLTTDVDWAIHLEDGSNIVEILFTGSDFRGVSVSTDGGTSDRYYSKFNGGIYTGNSTDGSGTIVDPTFADAACTNNDDYKAIQAAFAAINYVWDYDVSRTTAEGKLKWSGESKDCATWSTNATAIVDTNCVIEIPKTGDVSVVAYAVMALVTAAGALKFRK